MENILYTFLGLFILFITTRPFTILFHELGHAIPAALLTREKVRVYLGSYGEPDKSFRLRIGLLEVWCKYNPFAWKQGLCVPEAKNISLNRQIIYIFCGPLASSIVAFICCYLIFTFDGHGSLKLFFVTFAGSALLDLIINLIPFDNAVLLHNGERVYSDGRQLKKLFFHKTVPPEYTTAIECYHKEDFAQAAAIFEDILNNGKEHENIFRSAIGARMQNKNYQQALELHERFKEKCSPNSFDYANAGLLKSRLGRYEDALEDYNTSIQLDPRNQYSLNNRGFTYNLLGQYEKAVADFNAILLFDPSFPYAYSNRGLSKIKLGQPEEALKDIRHSLELDPQNAYAYRHLGIYYLEKGDKKEAHRHFLKARELDPDTHDIARLIAQSAAVTEYNEPDC